MLRMRALAPSHAQSRDTHLTCTGHSQQRNRDRARSSLITDGTPVGTAQQCRPAHTVRAQNDQIATQGLFQCAYPVPGVHEKAHCMRDAIAHLQPPCPRCPSGHAPLDLPSVHCSCSSIPASPCACGAAASARCRPDAQRVTIGASLTTAVASTGCSWRTDFGSYTYTRRRPEHGRAMAWLSCGLGSGQAQR